MRSPAWHPQQRTQHRPRWTGGNQFVRASVLPSLDPWCTPKPPVQTDTRDRGIEPEHTVSLAQPEAHQAYRSGPRLETSDRQARARLAKRAFSHFLSSQEAAHLSPERRQSLQRIFGCLIGA